MGKGWDFFTTDPGAEESITCPTCNEVMEVERNAYGATSSIMAMANKKRYYDRFFCKFAEEEWHQKVKMQKQEAENVGSKRSKAALLKKAEEIIKAKSPESKLERVNNDKKSSSLDKNPDYLSVAWPPFALKLAAALAKLKEDQYLVLSVMGSNRFVQFAAQGSFGMRVETTSNSYLSKPEKLNKLQISTLLDYGWHAPTGSPSESTPERDPDGSLNFFVEFAAPVSFEAVANLAVRTLAEILHIPHPGFLEYKAFGKKRKMIALTELGLFLLGLQVIFDNQPTPSKLPPKPANFECHYAGVNWKPQIECPTKCPRTAKFVASVEWAWSPMNNRQDKYYLSMNRSRTHWILWNGYFDEVIDEYVDFPYAYGPRKGVSSKIAAIYLLLDGWRGEVEEYESPDQFHLVGRSGILSVDELVSIAELVWPENKLERVKAEVDYELNKTGWLDYPYLMAFTPLSSSYVRQLLEKARLDKAPRNAILKDEEGRWRTVDESKDKGLKARLDLIIKEMVGEGQEE